MEKLIRRGAEADIYLGRWFEEQAVFKVREARAYRQPILDEKIREHRTVREASLLVEAREAGVSTPIIYFVDSKAGEIVMQYIEGKRVKEVLYCLDLGRVKAISRKIGREIAKLHKEKIIHGDLTTSNFILTARGQLVLIDFGLAFFSQRLEDRAVDLHLIKEVLTSAHSDVADYVFKYILEGYQEVSGEEAVKELLSKIKAVERRGRYAKVE